MLLTTKQLESRFQSLLKGAERIDIASAWISDKENPAFAALERAAKDSELSQRSIRILVGVEGNGTSPSALKRMNAIAKLRIVEEGRLFHPKVIIFVASQGPSHAWIGSANLTRRGFQLNEEVMLEIEDTLDIEKWFNRRWKKIGNQPNIAERILDYECNYKPPRPNETTELESEGRSETVVFTPDPNKKFAPNVRLAILWVLTTEGSGANSLVITRVGELLEPIMNEYLRGRGKSGEIIWRHNVCSVRQSLVNKGIVKASKDVATGVWELTQQGESIAQEELRAHLEDSYAEN